MWYRYYLAHWWLVLIVPLWNWNYILCASSPTAYRVLIVPLWNWNLYRNSAVRGLIRFNRTFMELKLQWRVLISSVIWRFNRTFMELKLDFKLEAVSVSPVLIVPLWNWNNFPESAVVHLLAVLIVPLWNWN